MCISPDRRGASVVAETVAVGPVGQHPMVAQQGTEVPQGRGRIGADPLPGRRRVGPAEDVLEGEV